MKTVIANNRLWRGPVYWRYKDHFFGEQLHRHIVISETIGNTSCLVNVLLCVFLRLISVTFLNITL